MKPKIQGQCPECHLRLSYSYEDGHENKMATCPRCGFQAKARLFLDELQQSSIKSIGEMPTRIIGIPKGPDDTGQIRVLATGEVQWLNMGSNIIGRRVDSGDADIKISNDTTMSRRHVQIDVVKTKYGLQHRLVEMGSLNLVQLNEEKIQRGDILILRFGDTLTLGQTKIILEPIRKDTTRLTGEEAITGFPFQPN